jgi:hypothetical protein
LHSEAAHTNLAGSQVGSVTFTFNAGTVTCTQESNSGTTSSATAITFNLSLHFNSCTAFGFLNAPIDATPCFLQVHLRIIPPRLKFTIICEEVADSLTITAFNCHVKVPSQELGGTASFTNEGSGTNRDIKFDLNVTGMDYVQESKSFPGCSNGTSTNGSLLGSITLKGANTSGTQVGIWIA